MDEAVPDPDPDPDPLPFLVAQPPNPPKSGASSPPSRPPSQDPQPTPLDLHSYGSQSPTITAPESLELSAPVPVEPPLRAVLDSPKPGATVGAAAESTTTGSGAGATWQAPSTPATPPPSPPDAAVADAVVCAPTVAVLPAPAIEDIPEYEDQEETSSCAPPPFSAQVTACAATAATPSTGAPSTPPPGIDAASPLSGVGACGDLSSPPQKSVVAASVHATPTTDGRMEDEFLVVVEDISENEDEEEDATRSARSSSSSLSAHAPLFFPAR